jgi:membrane fusion protein (multidrug efflux system)
VLGTAIISKPTNDGQFLIVQKGLKKGDRVLINGSNLKDSTLVMPKNVNADSLYNQIKKN